MRTETLAAQYKKLDRDKLITCHPAIICGSRVSSNGVVIQTTNSNAKLTVTLMTASPNSSLGNYYAIVPKGMDIYLGPVYYNKLLLQNNVQLNDQRAITLINSADHGFFSLKFNPTREIQGLPAITTKSFLFNQCRAISLEQTKDIEEIGKYLLIVHNNNITQAKTKIGKILRKLQQSSAI